VPTIDDAIRAENDALAAAINEIAPSIEGLEDFLRLNLQEQSRLEAGALLAASKERVNLIMAARRSFQGALDSIQALRESGYPRPIHRTVSDAVLMDLSSNRSSIDTALGLFQRAVPPQAVSLNLNVSGEPT